MRLQEIHIDGYGLYNDFHFIDIPPGLSVIRGVNEAGKSTLLSFLRSILFGFPDKRTKEGRENLYEPLRGGQKGGRLVVVPEGGEQYVIERHGGAVKVMMPDGTEAGDSALRHLIGSAGRDVFQNVFAFSLKELQEVASLERSDVKEAIYSAGMGTSARRITDAQRWLSSRRDELFKPTARKTEITQLLSQIEQLNQEIRECESEPERYAQLLEDLSLRNSDKSELKKRLQEKRVRLARVRELLKGWDDWISMQQADADLKNLEEVENFPTDGVSQLERLLENRRSLSGQLEPNARKIASRENERSSIVVDEKLIEHCDEIYDIEPSRKMFSNELRSLHALEPDKERMEKTFVSKTRELGPDWDEQRVTDFDNSIAVEERARSFHDRLREGEDAIKTARSELAVVQQALSESREQEESDREALEQLARPADNFDHDSVRQLQLDYKHYDQAARDLPALESEREAGLSQLSESLQDIGPDWDEEKLEKFDSSITVREEIRSHQSRLDAAAREVEEAEKDAASSGEALQQDETALEEAEKRIQDSGGESSEDDATLEKKHIALQDLRSDFNKKEKLSEKKAQLEERKIDLEVNSGTDPKAGKELLLIPLLGIIACLLLGLAREDWVSGVLTMVGAIALFVILKSRTASPDVSGAKARFDQVEEELAECVRSMRDLEEKMAKCAGEMGITTDIDAASIERADEELLRLDETLGQLKIAESNRLEAREAFEEAKSKNQLAEAAIQESSEEDCRADKDWTTWLDKADINQSLSPEKALDVISGLAAAREKLNAVAGLRGRIEAINGTICAFRDDLRMASKTLGAGEVTDDNIPEVYNHLVSLTEEQNRIAEDWKSASGKVKETRELLAKREVIAKRACDKLKSSDKEKTEICGEWKEDLRQMRLPDDLSTEGALDFFRRLETCRTLLTALDDKRSQLERAQKFVQKYRERGQALAGAIGRPSPEPDNVTAFVDKISSDLNEAMVAKRNAQKLQEDIEEFGDDKRDLEEQLKSSEREIAELIEKAGTSTEDEFRRRGEIYEERERLRQAIKQHDSGLEKQTGRGKAHAAFKEELSQSTPENLNTEVQKLDEIIESSDDELDEVNRDVGGLQSELKGLESSEQASQLRMQRESLKAELNSKAHEWSVLQMASLLITRAREKYERERRPAVLNDAEGIFKKLTGGRYIELNAPIGESRVRVRRNDQKFLDVNDLSRGTAEQLYLALRFGFIQEYANKSEPLPLIFDEILVNFDPERSKAAIEAILELAQSHQILLFSCHPESVARVHAADPSIPVRKLSDGKLLDGGIEVT